ncbi:MAG: Chromosomal replication initiator protein DnaA, partial [Candidatus Anoxychlamydiales bacterium]|nr:Chromosomal replication initiator protein DnaA [Candidatus Anoxychlamydiales bacterium]
MKAWKLFLSDLEKKIGATTVRKWLYSLKVIKFDACNLYLEAENHFEARWFEEHIRPILKRGFYNENFHKIKVHLSLKNADLKSKTIKDVKNQITSDPLETYLTFAFFIASEKNLMSVKLLKETVDKGTSFNPIF